PADPAAVDGETIGPLGRFEAVFRGFRAGLRPKVLHPGREDLISPVVRPLEDRPGVGSPAVGSQRAGEQLAAARVLAIDELEGGVEVGSKRLKRAVGLAMEVEELERAVVAVVVTLGAVSLEDGVDVAAELVGAADRRV